jgi:hypothetical protein
VRYADGPPLFIEQLDEVEPVTEVRIAESDETEVAEREPLEPAPWIESVARVVLWTVVGVFAALVIAKLWRERPAFDWRRRRAPAEPFDVLADAAQAVGDDAAAQYAALRTGIPRDAIVACWSRLEASVVSAGVEPRPSDTSTELVERVLAQYQLDRSAIGTLAALYREARFSTHEMPERDRAAAITALEEVHAGLRRARQVTA